MGFPRHRRLALGDAIVLDQAVDIIPDRRLELRLALLEIEHLHVRLKAVEDGVGGLGGNPRARGVRPQAGDAFREVRSRGGRRDEGG